MASPAVLAAEPRRFEVADVLRDHAYGLRLTAVQARAVRDIVACRTERLGGHLEVCRDCGFSRGSYNSCRNRHCPKCQILKQELWAEAQEALLLPTLYFQIVFTIPMQLHAFLRRAPEVCLTLLFEAVAESLNQIARTKLKASIVYAKPPLAGPGHVVRYLSRYVHRIAIANSRITDYDGRSVTFRYKDRADGNATKSRTVSGPDFARLFLQHVLPPRFVRIRHYGFLAARSRKHLARCRELLGAQPASPPQKDATWVAAFERLFGSNPLQCPACKTGVLVVTRVLPPARA